MSDRAAVQTQTAARPSITPTASGVLQRQCACGQHTLAGGECEQCKKKRVGASLADARLQRAAIDPSPVHHVPPIVHEVLRSPGQPLDAATRGFMEPRFGQDFSQVRVHNNAKAAESASSVNALAYTIGRDVFFGSGQYVPSTPAGQRLIAHELVHVVQQRGVLAMEPKINHPDGQDEMEANRISENVVRGDAVFAPPVLQAPGLQRVVRESISQNNQPHAQVCMVHLHGDEQNALHVAEELRRDYCANLVHLNSTTRAIHVDVGHGRRRSVCLADPNRIFTDAGLTNRETIRGRNCNGAIRDQAVDDLRQFRDHQLLPAIHQCRARGGSGASEGLPVVALHNNANDGDLTIRSYQPGGPYADTSEIDPARLGRAANPSVILTQDPDNFFLVTDERDFRALSASRNVVLQGRPPGTDDGSLSYVLASDRYINVEAEGKIFSGETDPRYVTNRDMALEALRQIGVGHQPCAAPAGALQRQASGDGTGASVERAPEIPASSRAEPEPGGIGGFMDWLIRLLREVVRVLEQANNMPPPMPREAPPANLPADCMTFPDQASLDARKAHWASVVAGMPVNDVIGWIVGLNAPPAAVTREASRQRDCMLEAIRAAAVRPGSGISLPSGILSRSDLRGFSRQRSIWERKYEFRGPPFDRITDHARRTCGSLINSGETRWDPANPRHRVCWNVSPQPGASPPVMPTGARPLMDDERQAEILQASSAPGISRHHWGTDFDLFDPDMNPDLWQTGRTFGDEYSWMRGNASAYGFMQSFTTTSTFMRRGYIEERWHWSYWPISQALLEFARAHQSNIEARLMAEWGSNPQFSFIRQHWQEYMFNVSERPEF